MAYENEWRKPIDMLGRQKVQNILWLRTEGRCCSCSNNADRLLKLLLLLLLHMLAAAAAEVALKLLLLREP